MHQDGKRCFPDGRPLSLMTILLEGRDAPLQLVVGIIYIAVLHPQHAEAWIGREGLSKVHGREVPQPHVEHG